ncbi:hypothetical protein C8F04DRAFT_1279282 [Mycena alexandri]|uniref:RING-type domain-containing protein n=1 Tax=Mycena alexandri TaxID=1745969 RepID=A0AAD6S244_9AGAR|nr:hypothetical protein C8F04DRAFT_1279282 [Mycena alexandri]
MTALPPKRPNRPGIHLSLAPTMAHTCEGHVPCLLYNKSAADMERIRAALGISSANTHVRSTVERDRCHRGSRDVRDIPLTEDTLYMGPERPAPLQTDRAHQTCSLCLQVKSHPVSYLCGHSHCYVCIRLHLETEWRCPIRDCRTLMRRAPYRHHPEEEGIALDFPDRDDRSTVTYNWDGLTFPRPPVHVEEEQ